MKKEQQKMVCKFSNNAIMKFKPQNYTAQSEAAPSKTVAQKMSSIFTNIFNKAPAENANTNSKPSKSVIMQPRSLQRSNSRSGTKSEISEDQQAPKIDPDYRLCYLQKVNQDTFLIGNENQLDSISIEGVSKNVIVTEFNWSLSAQGKIKKLAVQIKRGYIIAEVNDSICVYKFNSKKPKEEPKLINKVRFNKQIKFLIAMRDNYFGVFYEKSATVYSIDDNTSSIKSVFNSSYGVQNSLTLYDIPKPIQGHLHLFFVELSQKQTTYILWKIQMSLKMLSEFRNLSRVYQVPLRLLGTFTLDHYSKDVILMNFKYEILAAKDGFLVDTVNINIQDMSSRLVYNGSHLLHISDSLLLVYKFKINMQSKPQRIEMQPVDSVVIEKQKNHTFFNCIQMLGNNYMLLFQLQPEFRKRGQGQIRYSIAVTKKISVQQKLDEIFNFSSAELQTMAQRQLNVIQQKCDIAFKIGLTRKQVYLKLWRISSRETVQDYKFLLDTLDYETIKDQIQRKLKKCSMPFNQVYKIEQQCFEMVREHVFSSNSCTKETLINYSVSHFLLRKLAFFRDCVTLKRGQSKASVITIDIQQYSFCEKFQLKEQFIRYAVDIAIDGKDLIEEMKLFVKSFLFALRPIYKEILSQLVANLKSKLVVFMELFPQILPLRIKSPEQKQKELKQISDQKQKLQKRFKTLNQQQLQRLKELQTLPKPDPIGLWSQIEKQEWESHLYISDQVLTSIYNRQNVQQVIKSVWFRRHNHTLHDLLPFNKAAIQNIQKSNKSGYIFYFFIEKVLQQCDQETYVKTFQLLQQKYERMPEHIKGKIRLYKRLHDYFKEQKHYTQGISAFMQLRDHQVFRQIFKLQKVRKGCLLKEVKKIYELSQRGRELYNSGLLSYFESSESQISDLKYILNRLNNEKREFHIENQSIYEVLVKAMKLKLRYGSGKDISFDQVIIYFENITLSNDNPVVSQLGVLMKLNQQAQRFARMKINMSLQQILDNSQQVTNLLINTQIEEKEIFKIRDQTRFIETSYEIIAQIQLIRDKIYQNQNDDLVYFVYLAKLMEKIQMIPYAKLLLQDQYLLQYYNVNEKITENLVIYIYKWKLSQDPVYIKSIDYLNTLVAVLPEQNQCRLYIQAQIEFAVIFSSDSEPVEYPLTSNDAISIQEIAQIIQRLSKQHILALDLQRVHSIIKRMQELSLEFQVTTLPQICQTVIVRLIELDELKESIKMIRKLIQYYGRQENYSIVFCFAILGIIIKQLSDSHRKFIIKMAFYLFQNPLKLLQFIQKRVSNSFSYQQQQRFIDQYYQQVRSNKCFNPNCILLDNYMLKKYKQNQNKYYLQIQELIFQTWAHLQSNREDFARNPQFSFIYIMLINDPYAIAKFIFIRQKSINIKVFRSYVSYVFKEEIFGGIDVLYFSRRAVSIILNSLWQGFPLESIMNESKNMPLFEYQQNQDLMNADFIQYPFESKLQRSIQVFTEKIRSLTTKDKKKKSKAQKLEQQKTPQQIQEQEKERFKLEIQKISRKNKRIDSLLSSQQSVRGKQPSQYPFNDSDDNYEEEEKDALPQSATLKNKKSARKFDPSKQRQRLAQRQGKVALFISTAGNDQSEETNLIRTTSPSGRLKSAMSMGAGLGFQSLQISKKFKNRKASGQYQKDSLLYHSEAKDLTISKSAQDLQKKPSSSEINHIKLTQSVPYNQYEMTQNLNVNKSPYPMSNSSPQQATSINKIETPSKFARTTPVKSATRGKQQQSPINVVTPEEQIPPSPTRHMVSKESAIEVHLPQEIQNDNKVLGQLDQQMEIFVKQVDEDNYTSAYELAKRLLQDYSGTQTRPIFNLSLISIEQQKQFGRFEEYLKQLIQFIYLHQDSKLKINLLLIKQITSHYSSLQISNQFLQYYIAFENYNIRYKSEYRIREMFPIQGIFLDSKDPIVLFDFVKESILKVVDYEKIVIFSQLIINVLKKSQIKDELYLSYLAKQIEIYGNENSGNQAESTMLKERIEGLLLQVTMTTSLIERAAPILSSVSVMQKRKELANLIKQVLVKKKKQYLVRQFDKKVASLLE